MTTTRTKPSASDVWNAWRTVACYAPEHRKRVADNALQFHRKQLAIRGTDHWRRMTAAYEAVAEELA